jgi:hypothetical protein
MTETESAQHSRIDWLQHIDNYRTSGQSKATYCQSQKLTLKQFEHHYRRWHENMKNSVEFERDMMPADFSPVILKPSSPTTDPSMDYPANSGIELRLPNGVCCKVEINFCKMTLKQVMEIV